MKKIEPRRLVLGLASFAYIIFLWVKKNVAGAWSSLSTEALLPVILTSVAVSALKIVAIAAVVFLVRWLISKCGEK